ncbi:hydrolase [Rhodococcus rhodochrous]|nr:hydrolase [Rhodococcus rhodochrous]
MSSRFRIERVDNRRSQRSGRFLSEHCETNVWVVGDDRDAVIVDAGGRAVDIAGVVGDWCVTAVICTQGRRAHVSAAVEVGIGLCAPILLHPGDYDLWQAVHGQRQYWRLDDGQRIAVAGDEIRVLHTPSVTAGSVALHIERRGVVFTGDALRNGCEPPGHFPAPAPALEPLSGLPADTRVHPGHGDCFVLGEAFSST